MSPFLLNNLLCGGLTLRTSGQVSTIWKLVTVHPFPNFARKWGHDLLSPVLAGGVGEGRSILN